jgi:hypothetical protein
MAAATVKRIGLVGGPGLGLLCYGLLPLITRHDPAHLRKLDGSDVRRILVERARWCEPGYGTRSRGPGCGAGALRPPGRHYGGVVRQLAGSAPIRSPRSAKAFITFFWNVPGLGGTQASGTAMMRTSTSALCLRCASSACA